MNNTPDPAWASDDVELARLALHCLDLTELGDACSAADVDALCAKAQGHTPDHSTTLPPVAAVCVWPRFAPQARQSLPTNIRVAAVVNFPGGNEAMAAVIAQVEAVRQAGAQEVDCVLPYQAWLAGEHAKATALVRAVRRASQGMTLKLILESGALSEPRLLQQACQMALAEGVDFLKTSTGKIPQGASLDAAEVLLSALAQHPQRERLGFKPSGGLRTVADVRPYALATARHLGPQALTPERFRIGASSLWNDIARLLSGQASPAPHTTTHPSTY